jgi:hypothetical protein
MNSTALTMIAVIMTAAFMVTAFVWQQPQQTQALRGSESSSPSCVENQLCDTSITKSSTPSSKLTSSPYSASSSKLTQSPASSLTLTLPPSSKLKHHNFHSSTSITSHDTSSVNSTGSLSNDLSHLFD